MADKTYYAESSDGTFIRLKGQLGMGAAVIRKDQVASVAQTFGKVTVETTGGATYVVLVGVRRKQKDITNTVFGEYGVSV